MSSIITSNVHANAKKRKRIVVKVRIITYICCDTVVFFPVIIQGKSQGLQVHAQCIYYDHA